MYVNEVSQLGAAGSLFKKCTKYNPREIKNVTGEWVGTPVSFGPCHSPFAGKGHEELHIIGGDSTLSDGVFRGTPELHDEVISNALCELGASVLISVGHYVPSAKHSHLAPNNALDSIRKSRPILQKLVALNKRVALLVVVNDIKVSAEDRRVIYDNYSLPISIYEEFRVLEVELGIELEIIVISEAKLAERLRREKKRLCGAGVLKVRDDGGYYVVGDESGTALFHHHNGDAARCIRAFARLPKLPTELGFSSFVQVMPRCGSQNSHLGYSLGRLLYGDIPAILLYRTFRCW